MWIDSLNDEEGTCVLRNVTHLIAGKAAHDLALLILSPLSPLASFDDATAAEQTRSITENMVKTQLQLCADLSLQDHVGWANIMAERHISVAGRYLDSCLAHTGAPESIESLLIKRLSLNAINFVVHLTKEASPTTDVAKFFTEAFVPVLYTTTQAWIMLQSIRRTQK